MREPTTTAALIGATGLVGSQLLERLLDDRRVARVVSLGRRTTGRASPKLEEHVVDFEAPQSWAARVKADVAFSVLGTTREVGRPLQRKVDYQYQLAFAEAAAANGVPALVLCSASSASPGSPIYYFRLKGELDRDVQALGFTRLRVVRPNLLQGERQRPRPSERLSGAVLTALNAVGLARRHRPTPAAVVAQAMLNAGFDPAPGTRFITQAEVFAEACAS